MDQKLLIIISLASIILFCVGLFFFFSRKKCENREAQKLLNEYLNSSLTSTEIGTFYERYIGHLYEEKGYYVKYHGALNGYDDLGRDLIVEGNGETLIIQAKCWAKNKVIGEKHIFQLYGSMMHYKKTHPKKGNEVKAVFITTANYSDVAERAAKVLGVQILNEELKRNYPLIKCNVNKAGDKFYHLPFDPFYDKINLDSSQGKAYVHTVDEAVARGFRRARGKNDKAA
jgi:restriction endonuclease Mrr